MREKIRSIYIQVMTISFAFVAGFVAVLLARNHHLLLTWEVVAGWVCVVGCFLYSFRFENTLLAKLPDIIFEYIKSDDNN